MTREELVGSLMEEGFPRREAEHEADLIQGAAEDDRFPTARSWELIVRLVPQEYRES
jgi:hypothetical protein